MSTVAKKEDIFETEMVLVSCLFSIWVNGSICGISENSNCGLPPTTMAAEY